MPPKRKPANVVEWTEEEERELAKLKRKKEQIERKIAKALKTQAQPDATSAEPSSEAMGIQSGAQKKT
ncbi:hypothetical protein TWF225_008878 [Orbilia oligospora]|nr:hypothetical protein TWF225_008878 [Orbilia oligospora]KAF3243110.1 hypothetical protein TWF128_010325 [Orbilia oligospora]KAF3264844.1 hypothetical protein TWF217_003015 [Orbilia oligospora]